MCAGPSAHKSVRSAFTSGIPIASATRSTSTGSPAGFDNGIQTSPLQAPSGFSNHPVPASNSARGIVNERNSMTVPSPVRSAIVCQRSRDGGCRYAPCRSQHRSEQVPGTSRSLAPIEALGVAVTSAKWRGRCYRRGSRRRERLSLTHVFAGNPLDRADLARRDAAWLAQAYRDPRTRVLPMWQLNVLLDTSRDPHLGWLDAARAAALEVDQPPIFLGLLDGVADSALHI